MLKLPNRIQTRFTALVAAAAIAWSGAVVPSVATDFSTDSSGNLKEPTATGSACPTLSNINPIEVWYNTTDIDERGYRDPGNQDPWPLMTKTAQIICGAADNAHIRIGMFFMRALGTMTDTSLGSRPETDPEVVYNALEWVHDNRNVTIDIVLEAKPMPTATRKQMTQRLEGIANISYCDRGCMNQAARSRFPDAINHEKIIAIDHTIWGDSDGNTGSDDSAVLSSSGNWARSQTRTYYQESVLVYGDARYQQYLADRVDTMIICADGCKTTKGWPATQKNWLINQRDIWVDPLYSHQTSDGRGTWVSFAPAPKTMRNYYLQALDKVDCTVQDKIRIAMFRMTDGASVDIVKRLKKLKSQGCSIKVMLTSPVGGWSVSSKVKKKMKAADIWLKCSAIPLHTKILLIGSDTGNEAKIVTSTATMGVVSLTQSDEHTTVFDSTRATIGTYAEAIRRAYGQYAEGWDEISHQAKGC